MAQDRQWWRIYEDSFPPEEREPAEVVVNSLRTSVGMAFRARRTGATVGIATTHLLLHPAAVFLVYLAVDGQHRNASRGGTLFEYAWESSARRLREQHLSPLGLIWEVDRPGAASSPADEFLRQRRIAFFQRHCGVLLSRSYWQPPVNGTETVPMQLMYRPDAASCVPDTATVEALVRAIYFEKYGAVNKISADTLQDLLLRSAADSSIISL